MPDDEVTALTTARPQQDGGHLHPPGQQSTVMTATPEGHRRPVSQLTARELDLYSNQLARCLKALSTDAPIRAEVQCELVAVYAEQQSRTQASQAQQPCCPRDVSGLTVSESATRRGAPENVCGIC